MCINNGVHVWQYTTYSVTVGIAHVRMYVLKKYTMFGMCVCVCVCVLTSCLSSLRCLSAISLSDSASFS